MYLEVLLTNHLMEDNLNIHLEEVHHKEICLEDHHSIHLLDHALDSWIFIPPWYQPPIVQPVIELATKLPYMKLQYPTYVKDTNLDAHIKMFKKAIKTNGETMEANIINLFRFIFKNNIFEWGENYVQSHPNYSFWKVGINILQTI